MRRNSLQNNLNFELIFKLKKNIINIKNPIISAFEIITQLTTNLFIHKNESHLFSLLSKFFYFSFYAIRQEFIESQLLVALLIKHFRLVLL